MANTLEVKIVNGMLAYSALTSLLATAPDGAAAIFEMQEYQGTTFPAITYMLVSAVPQYSSTTRLATLPCRVQFTIWANDPETARSVETQLLAWIDQFNAYDPTNAAKPRQPNEIVMRRQGGNPQTQPLTYWRIVDANIWNNESF